MSPRDPQVPEALGGAQKAVDVRVHCVGRGEKTARNAVGVGVHCRSAV